jgi:AsmA family protein
MWVPMRRETCRVAARYAAMDQPFASELTRPPGEDPPAQRRGWKRVPTQIRIVTYMLLALCIVWLVLFITKGRFLRHPFETIASKSLQREVTIGGDFQLYFDPVNVKFYAENMTIANPAWVASEGGMRRPFFHARLIDTRISLIPLIFADRKRARWLNLRDSAVDLQWSGDGKRNTWTFGDPDAKGEPFQLPIISRADVIGTNIRYRDPRLLLFADIDVDTVRAKDTRFASDIRFQGRGTMRDKPFTLRGGLLSPNETVTGGANPLVLEARSGPTVLHISGTLPAATQIEGADLDMKVRGPNLSLLFDFLGVAIPDTRTYHVRSDLTYAEKAWRFTRLQGVFGASDIGGSMTVSMPAQRLKIDATLATNTLDIIDAGPFFGYDPQALATRGAAAAVSQPGGNTRILPDAPLRIDAISRFDADVKYSVKRIRAENVPISNIAVAVLLDHSLLALSPLTFDMAGGFVSSDIAINARVKPVHTRYDIRLSPTPMGKLLGRWGVEESGTTGTVKARVQMAGDGDSIRQSLATSNGRIAIILPAGSMWARNIQLSELDIGTFVQKMFMDKLKDPVQINCGLIGFTVRDGIAAADPILIDTRKNVIVGRGGFSFRNESIDMAVRADGKKFSLFSGQSPIGINGSFAAPGISPISPQLVARAGVGLGLGLVASPLAAVLAFVDVGDAKSAACGPVLAGAQATAQRTTKGKPRDDVGRGTTAKAESGNASDNEKQSQQKKFLGVF